MTTEIRRDPQLTEIKLNYRAVQYIKAKQEWAYTEIRHEVYGMCCLLFIVGPLLGASKARSCQMSDVAL